MTKRLIPIFVALCACCIAGYAAGNNRALNNTLRDLKNELHTSYTHLPQTQDYFDGVYEQRHQEILDAITTSSEQSIMLYTQESHMTFNMTYVLKSVSREYKTFTESKHYDQGINTVNFHIDRYARLIEALRRLPPQMKEIKETIVPDSLLYHNDSLDIHFSQSASTLEKEIIRMVKDSASAPFVLDEKGEEYRDSCIFYASEVLKMYASNRTKIMRDSIHYQEASMRMKENYEYAEERYMELQDYIFREGQMPYIALIKDYSGFKKVLDTEISKQYDLSQFENQDEDEKLRIEDLMAYSPVCQIQLAEAQTTAAAVNIDRYYSIYPAHQPALQRRGIYPYGRKEHQYVPLAADCICGIDAASHQTESEKTSAFVVSSAVCYCVFYHYCP